MAPLTFNCPNCGAPLDFDGGEETTIHCPFCNTSVVVPKEVRPSIQPKITIVTPTAKPRGNIVVFFILAGILLFIGGIAFIINLASRPPVDLSSVSNSAETVAAAATQSEPPTDTPEPSPTPAYANPKLSFGEKGIGQGQFNDSRYLAVDGAGTLYVADYQGSRVQAFDSTGKYLSQFMVGNSKTIILGLTANHQGKVFIATSDGPDILQYDGKTGQMTGKLSSPNAGEFGDLFAMADGGLAAAWYEGRWGMITSLEGHRDDLVVFDSQGKIKLTIPSFISGQTGDLALDNYITVDGLGKFFALSDRTIYQFTSEGKYSNKFGGSGSGQGQFDSANAIAVDGQDQIYISDVGKIQVFSADGRFLTDFPTHGSTEMMAFDEQGNLWVLGDQKVTQYVIQGK